ncbi:MAG: ABC transporter substrate-binding protein [Actinomycetota bacterium]|nr:ABC transporter substrate-binding protein [Actinomycetota bacterium]
MVAVLAVLALVATACGDDDDDAPSAAETDDTAADDAAGDDTTDDAADDTAGDDATADDDGESAAAAPEGEPVKVMTIAPVNTNLPPDPNIPAAAEVYEQWLNDRGGVAGRPLEVITCDDRGDPNEAANCARQAVEEEVVAVVGSFVFDASRIIPVLEENDLTWFGACCPLVAQEFTSPNSFPLGSLFPAQGTGNGWKMAQDGCENPVVVYVDIPAGDAAHPAFLNGYEVGGGDPDAVRVVKIPLEAQDYSAQVAQAISDGTDCIAGGISDSNWATWFPAMMAAGADQRIYGLQGNLNGKIAEQFPEVTENAIVSNSYPNISAPVWDDYRGALDEYDAPDLDWNSLAGLGTWTAYTAFVDIVEGMDGEVSAASFFEAANNTTELDTGGMVPILDLSTPWDGYGGDFPRIFNRTVFFDEISDGVLTPLDDQSYDMTGPIDGNPMG